MQRGGNYPGTGYHLLIWPEAAGETATTLSLSPPRPRRRLPAPANASCLRISAVLTSWHRHPRCLRSPRMQQSSEIPAATLLGNHVWVSGRLPTEATRGKEGEGLVMARVRPIPSRPRAEQRGGRAKRFFPSAPCYYNHKHSSHQIFVLKLYLWRHYLRIYSAPYLSLARVYLRAPSK
jgi:hypothetical protein